MAEENNSPEPVGVSVSNGLPDVKVVVTPGSTVKPTGSDELFTEGAELTLDGPTAAALISTGHVEAVNE